MVGEKLTLLDENGLVNNDYAIDEVKPYLFPLSSMTEEQREELKEAHLKDQQLYAKIMKEFEKGNFSVKGTAIPHYASEWCNKNHFDYRGLIEKSLALDATGLGIYE